jgi:Ca-activated chloride channel family protein
MTDGYVGNDMTIIDAVKKNIGDARLFSFGVGNSVNRYLLDKMAEMGRGEAEYVTLNRHGDEVAEAFQRKIGTPLLTDISIDWANLPVKEVYPKRNPDLFTGKPVIITGRYSGPAKGEMTLKGKRAGEPYERKIEVSLPGDAPSHDVLASLWARTCIEDLMDQDLTGIQQGTANRQIEEQITELGLKFRLMTQFTSFVAVEEKVVTEGGVPKTVVVPVEMPDGVSYEGVFGDQKEAKTESGSGAYSPHTRGTYSNLASPPGCQATPSSTVSKKSRLTQGYLSEEDMEYYQPPSKKPEEKLDVSLKGIAEKVRTSGTDGSLSLGGFEVKNGRIHLILTVTHVSEKTLDALKKAGFSMDTCSSSAKLITGSLPVDKIDEITKLPFVDRVEPFITSESSVNRESSGQGWTQVFTYFSRWSVLNRCCAYGFLMQ